MGNSIHSHSFLALLRIEQINVVTRFTRVWLQPSSNLAWIMCSITVAQGNSQQADQLFKQIEEQADSVIKVTAEAAYQRCLIAEDSIRYIEALNHCEKAVQLAPENMRYLNQAGIIKEKLANFKKAIEYFELALTNCLNTYGEDHPRVAGIRNNLAMTWQSLGKYQKAVAYYEKALVSFLKMFGEDHPIVVKVRFNLGKVWQELGEYQKALGFHEQALASDLKTYGKDHPVVGGDQTNLGLVWYSLSEYQKAIVYLEQALTSDLKTYGEDHPTVAIDKNNLGGAWRSIGQYQKAKKNVESVLEALEKQLGEDHPKRNFVRDHLVAIRKQLVNSSTEEPLAKRIKVKNIFSGRG